LCVPCPHFPQGSFFPWPCWSCYSFFMLFASCPLFCLFTEGVGLILGAWFVLRDGPWYPVFFFFFFSCDTLFKVPFSPFLTHCFARPPFCFPFPLVFCRIWASRQRVTVFGVVFLSSLSRFFRCWAKFLYAVVPPVRPNFFCSGAALGVLCSTLFFYFPQAFRFSHFSLLVFW